MKKKIIYSSISGIILLLLFIRFYPTLLLWPYYQKIDNTYIYSELPIEKNINKIIALSVTYKSRSKISGKSITQNVYLTSGGARWKLLAMRSVGAFAISIPITEDIIVNSSSVASNVVRNGSTIGGLRPLDRVITHEMTHGILRKHFGLFMTFQKPSWLVEGYCDYIADNSSLSSEDVIMLYNNKISHPAIPYYEGRLKIKKMIEKEGKTIDQIFAEN